MAKELQNTRIKNIHCTGRGHWRIIVEQEHWMRKYPFGLSSITLWEYTTTDSMDCIEGASILEANRENLIKNVDCIITPNKDWEEQETLDELIENMENDKQCAITREYLHTNLKRLIDEADARNAYIHFSWF